MIDSKIHSGVLVVLLDRLTTQRVPRLLSIKARLDRGERISDQDLAFLRDTLDTTLARHVDWDKNPELQGIIGTLTRLYKDITSKALANESR